MLPTEGKRAGPLTRRSRAARRHPRARRVHARAAAAQVPGAAGGREQHGRPLPRVARLAAAAAAAVAAAAAAAAGSGRRRRTARRWAARSLAPSPAVAAPLLPYEASAAACVDPGVLPLSATVPVAEKVPRGVGRPKKGQAAPTPVSKVIPPTPTVLSANSNSLRPLYQAPHRKASASSALRVHRTLQSLIVHAVITHLRGPGTRVSATHVRIYRKYYLDCMRARGLLPTGPAPDGHARGRADVPHGARAAVDPRGASRVRGLRRAQQLHLRGLRHALLLHQVSRGARRNKVRAP
jgi:hypothetical protein